MGSSKKQTIGYKYFAGIHMAICHGPVDSLKSIEAGEKEAWTGNVTGNTTISINKPDLFGGSSKEGGIVGSLDVLMGGPSQTRNSYLQSQTQVNIPAYRGILSVVLKKMYLTAMSQYIKPWAFKVKRTTNVSAGWQTPLADINGGANGSHMIRECFTNSSWGLGFSTSSTDDASFTAAAQTLFNEGFGLSMLLTGQTTAEEFIINVLRHISGVIFTDRVTGKFKLRLIRDDYDPNSLVTFDENNIIKLNSFERPQFAEMVNEIIVIYRPQGTREDASVTVQDLASIQAQGGVVSQTTRFPGIDNLNIASRVAQRELRQHSTPLAQVRITVNRDGWQLEPGSLFKLSWSSLGIEDLVCRVTSVNLGDFQNPQIIVDAVEDIFALPDNSYIAEQPPIWINPIGPPVASTLHQLRELPYWDIYRQFTNTSEIDDTSAYLQFLVQKPTVASPGYDFMSRPVGAASFVSQQENEYVPKAAVKDPVGYTDSSITFEDVIGAVEEVVAGTYAYIGNEIVRIDSINLSTLSMVVGRGCLDTIPAPHSPGSIIWFAEDFQGIDFTEYADGEIIEAKALVKTGEGILPEASAPTISTTMVGRQFKPYPPGKLRINSAAYPEEITGALTVSWAHRDRTLQLASLISEGTGNIGPEAGTTYELRLYDETNTLRKSENALTGTSYSWSTEEADSLLSGRLNSSVRVQLWSVRSGEDSLQIHDFSVIRPLPPFIVTVPVVSGNAIVGADLSSTDGTWLFDPISYSYQWKRDTVNISGEVTNVYTVTNDDRGYSLFCEVTATNAVGSTPELSGNGIFIPAPIAGTPWTPLYASLSAWYDATDPSSVTIVDTNKVSQLSDKSGKGRHFTQASSNQRPTLTTGINGLNVIEFNPANSEYMQADDWLGTVARQYLYIIGVRDCAAGRGLDLSGSGWSLGLGENLSTSVCTSNGTSSASQFSAPTQTAGDSIRTMGIKPGYKIFSKQDGSDLGSTVITETLGVLRYSSAGWQLGRFGAATAYFDGYFAEATIISSDQSFPNQDLIDRLEGYYAHKYGLVGNLPSGHPYKVDPPILRYLDRIYNYNPVSNWKLDNTENDDMSTVGLLLPMFGPADGTTFTDESNTPKTVTTFGNVKYVTDQYRFYGSSAIWDGSSDYLSVPYSSDIDVMGGDFTVEMWIRPTHNSQSSGRRVAALGGGAVGWNLTNGIHWLIQFASNNLMSIQIATSVSPFVSSTNAIEKPPLYGWSHVCFCVSGDTVYVGVNGKLTSTVIANLNRPSTNPSLAIGTIPGEAGSSLTNYSGYMQDFKITKGIAKYTSDFIPPNRASTIAYDELMANSLTKFGSPIYGVSPLVPDVDTKAITFNGSTDYFAKSVANYRSSDFTGSISFLVDLPDASTATNLTVLSSSDTAVTNTYFVIGVTTERKLYVAQRNSGDTPDTIVSDGVIPQATPAHCVITSSGSEYKLYINSVLQTLTISGTNSGDWFGDTAGRDNLVIGALIRASVENYFKGTLDEIQVFNYELNQAQINALFSLTEI